MARQQVTARQLWQTCIVTTAEAEEAVVALMERTFGQSPSAYTHAGTKITTTSIYEGKPLSAARRKDLLRGLQEIEACGLSVRPGTIRARKVPSEDWSESWKKHFPAIEIGAKLLIRPSWSKRRARKGQRVVVLNPGLSFGTGQHPTTTFCLEQLVHARRPAEQQSFLDIGTGSGILAIAAAKLRYSPVQAIDFDPVAVRTARANARRNRVHDRVFIVCQDLIKLSKESRAKYDLIGANLTDDLLIAASDKILHRLKPTGRLVLAGMRTSQFGAVRTAYQRQGLQLVSCRREDGWQSALFVRRPLRETR